jgi:peptidoglycan/LPS O-acetylase OafA/YrhL
MKRHDRIKGLDGIRALAFLLVLGGHSGFKWIPNGFGVTVFFFLSGYLITTLARLEWIRTQNFSVSRFYIRRAFRILPPLYCAILLAVGAAYLGILQSEIQWKAVAAIQLFLTNYAEQVSWITIPLGLSPLWSLAVEEHFYLAFPWIYVVLLKAGISRIRQAILFACVCVMILGWRLVLMGHYHVFWNRVYTGTDTRLDSILFGVMMAIVANPLIDDFPRLKRKWLRSAAAISVLILLASIAMRGEMFRQTARYSIQGLALVPVFYYVVCYSDSNVTKWLESRFLVRIGDLSYALYVFHYTVMFAVNTWITTNPFATFLLTFVVSSALAEASRRFVEAPAANLRNRVLARARSRPITPVMSSAS